MGPEGDVYIGTSGWHYPHWRGPFYPDELADADMFSYYARRFRTVEVNNTFYQLPGEPTLRAWRRAAPPGFVFAVKASRFITHMKKLTDPSRTLPPFLARVGLLGPRLGPILFQLPPRWRCNPRRLAEFLAALPPEQRCAFEFRDPSWYRPETYRALAAHRAAFCIYHLAGHLSPKEVTADFAYIRLHGPGGAYQGQYDQATLAGWAGAISAWRRQGRDVYCYFDNDQRGYAPQDAARLSEMVCS
ncbi:MAG: DUF72 domain-containing protein [Candidatus Bipolaricaulaceae bacterium]